MNLTGEEKQFIIDLLRMLEGMKRKLKEMLNKYRYAD